MSIAIFSIDILLLSIRQVAPYCTRVLEYYNSTGTVPGRCRNSTGRFFLSTVIKFEHGERGGGGTMSSDDGDSADDSSSDESAIAQVLREHYDSRTCSQAAAHPASAPRATAPVAAATAARGAGERPPSPPRGRAVRFPPQSPIQRSPRQLD